MKLLTKDLEKRFKEIGSQENEKDPIVIAKFFNPCGAGTWYATEYDPETKTFFGYVELLEGELGYFSLEELENINLPLGLKIERDLYTKEKRLSEYKN